jgi:hypothetical protein
MSMQGKSIRVIVEPISQPEQRPELPVPEHDRPAEPADTTPREPAGAVERP